MVMLLKWYKQQKRDKLNVEKAKIETALANNCLLDGTDVFLPAEREKQSLLRIRLAEINAILGIEDKKNRAKVVHFAPKRPDR